MEKGGEFFWLAQNTLAQVVEGALGSDIYAYQIALSSQTDEDNKSYSAPTLVGSIPSKSASNFRYNPATGNLVFSAEVYPDGNLTTVAEQDKQWEQRGNSAFVYDTTYVRHWDVWQGKKGSQLFSVKISKGQDGLWNTNNDFKSPLQGTKHVRIALYVRNFLHFTPFSILQWRRLEELTISMPLLPTSYTRRKTHNFQKPGIPNRMFVDFHFAIMHGF